ncbi:MAG: redoxin domain-containing protein [Fidelibacterota bacterium]
MKYFSLFLIVILIISGCAVLTKDAAEGFDYQKSLSFILKNQDQESPELYSACEEILPLTVKNNRPEDYRKVLRIYRNYDNVFSKALTLGFLSDIEPEDPVLQDSVFAASRQAHEWAHSDDFIRFARIHFQERDFNEGELYEQVNFYRTAISDNYAQLLLERRRPSDALSVYESLLKRHRDAGVLLNYAGVLNQLNRFEASLVASIEALRMNPGNEKAKEQISDTASLLGYSKAEIKTMIDETVFVGRNIMRQNLLADELDIPMPEFELLGIDSGRISSRDFEDKILIVSFFATWCPPCKKELPHLNDLYLEYRNDEEIEIIAVSTDEDKFRVRPFINEHGYEFPVYYAGGLDKKFRVKGIPTLFVIDKKGIIRYKKIGYREGEEFEKIMNWYIDEIKAAEDV